jgi:hypothetical protein
MACGGRRFFLGFSCRLDRLAPIAIFGGQGKAILFCPLLLRPWSHGFSDCIPLNDYAAQISGVRCQDKKYKD